jgi:hypothetical protein
LHTSPYQSGGVNEYYLHAVLLVEPFSPYAFRFTFEGEVSQDVPVDFATPQTLRDVIGAARKADPGAASASLFSVPRVASALDSGAEAPWSLRFELKDLRDKSFSQDEFLRFTPEDIAIMVVVPTDPVTIAVRLEKRVRDDEAPS